MGELRKIGKRLLPDERRQQLLHFAIIAYGTIGVERAGHGDVAKLANVSTATVFNYFPTRRALTEAVLGEITKNINIFFDYVAESVPRTENHIVKFISAYDNLVEAYPDQAKVFLNWSVSFGPTVRPAYLEFQEICLRNIIKVTGLPQNARTDARILYGAAQSYAIMKFDKTPPETLKQFAWRVSLAIKGPSPESLI